MRQYVARIAGALAAGLAALLTSKGVNLAPEDLAGLETFLTGIMTTVGLMAYGVVHRLFTRFMPGMKDSADDS